MKEETAGPATQLSDSRPREGAARPWPALLRAVRRCALLILLDAIVVALAHGLAVPLRFAGVAPERYLQALRAFIPLAVLAYVALNYLFGLYHRIWRYAGAEEVVPISASAGVSTLIVLLLDLFWPQERPLPLSTVLLGGFFSLAGFVAVRYRQRLVTGSLRRWRTFRERRARPSGQRQRVLIVGAGEAGEILLWRFQNHREGEDYEVVGFVDDDPAKRGLRVHGVPVLGDRQAIPDLVTGHRVDLIIIAIYNISGQDFRDILDLCERTPAMIRVLPNIFDFIRGTNGLPPIREVTLEDLLGRKPVEIDREACRHLLAGKVILVTGAAGSIGSELCCQILSFAPRRLLMLDNNESGLYDLRFRLGDVQTELAQDCAPPTPQALPLAPQATLIIADITDRSKMQAVFESCRPEIVFHAAAYKHVPLMEEHPDEAVRVNVLGTRIVAELAAEYGAERFVLVSTDKAINPCSVMGATKRLCEMLITTADGRPQTAVHCGLQPAAGGPRTLFTAVRFGNVLGSRGSVVPTFERQIDQGGPVTVTHPDMTRYFISVSEAVSLVIQAAALTEGGDIFMLDMGQRIRIDNLARRLIRLRGLRPEVDIPIVYTGPRPGEKMHEELLGDGEEREPTTHPYIFRIRNRQRATCHVQRATVDELITLARARRNGELVARLWELVRSESGNGPLLPA
jgi:FlaA1/EpsC-like NDP-sugar epimerase